MNIDKRKLIAALIFPIICLVLLATYKGVKVMTGKRVTIPVTGFDPRDLLSGHYLIYRLDLNTGGACSGKTAYGDVLVCINKEDDGSISSRSLRGSSIDRYRGDCDIILKGRCQRGRFTAGVEKFFIPEAHALKLDSVVRKGKGKLVLSVDYHGKASIVDLLINEKSWRDYVKE